MITLISSGDVGYFRALIEFERDLPTRLPPSRPASAFDAGFGDRSRGSPRRVAGAAQSPVIRNPPSGGDCAEEPRDLPPVPCGCFLSQLEPLETV